MKILDYLFYMLVKLQMKILKKDVPDSTWSAALANGLGLSFLVIAVMALICLVFPSQFSSLDKIVSFITDPGHPWRFVIASLFVDAAMVWRYFKFVDYETIAGEIKREHKQSFVSAICWIMWLVVPVCEFIIMRIYLAGQVRWW